MSEYFSPSQFPQSFLNHAEAIPPKIFFRGDPSLITRPAVAIVGSRVPTPTSISAAVQIAKFLARAGFVIVSGLARGVDRYAHEATLHRGHTVAVLGHGLDTIYPREHRGIAESIVEQGGALLSEYPDGVGPRPHRFPERNYLIAAIAWATVVVQAGNKSGSLSTAMNAVKLGRQLYVIPGDYADERFGGSHWLINQGAWLLASPSTIVDDFLSQFGEGKGVSPVESITEESTSPLGTWLKRQKQGASLSEIADEAKNERWNLSWREDLYRYLRNFTVVEIAPQWFLWTL